MTVPARELAAISLSVVATPRVGSPRQLKAKAEKRSYEVGPAAGEEMEKLAKEVMAQPPAVLERMKKILGNCAWPRITARHVAFALFYSPP